MDIKSVNNLLDFLEKTFNGGSDFNAPVQRCLDRLHDAKWANSDILLVRLGVAVGAQCLHVGVGWRAGCDGKEGGDRVWQLAACAAGPAASLQATSTAPSSRGRSTPASPPPPTLSPSHTHAQHPPRPRRCRTVSCGSPAPTSCASWRGPRTS